MKTATVSFVATLSLLVGVLERVRLLLDTGDDLFAGPFRPFLCRVKTIALLERVPLRVP